MKKEKNKYNPFIISKDKETNKHKIKEKTHIKNHTLKLEMNLSHPAKIVMKTSKEKFNLLESNSFKNKISFSPKQFFLSKDKTIFNNYINSDKAQKNINKTIKPETHIKYSINLTKNKNNSFSNNINYLHNNKNNNKINETSFEKNNFYKVKRNKISFSKISPKKNSKIDYNKK